jgi:hypothetical protein
MMRERVVRLAGENRLELFTRIADAPFLAVNHRPHQPLIAVRRRAHS